MLITIAEIGLAWVLAAGIVAWMFGAVMNFTREFAEQEVVHYPNPNDRRRAHRA